MGTTGNDSARDGRGTALVIGGGMAGCLSAWALRGRAERIVVVERDRYPDDADHRPGTPQGQHAHLLLEGGRRAMEDLLPGIGDELRAREATVVGLPADVAWLSAGGWMPRFRTDNAFLSCTRASLDHVVRERVRSDPSIEFVQGAAVVGLLGDATRVTGARVRTRGAGPEETAEIRAELVVDASGRTTAVPTWLAELGCPPVPEERVDAGASYSSRFYRRSPDADPGTKGIYLQSRPPQELRFGLLVPVEGDRWLVTVGGMRGAEPAPGEAGFDETLKLLRDPAIREALAGAEPVGEVRGFRPGACVRRHYERRSPQGFVAVGDAACSFNPVYGQGISTAAFGARALREAVVRHGIGEEGARWARRAIASAASPAWLMASSEDVRYAATKGGPKGPFVRVQHRYLDRLMTRATVDQGVAAAFISVMSLVHPPAALFHPKVLWPVLRG